MRSKPDRTGLPWWQRTSLTRIGYRCPGELAIHHPARTGYQEWHSEAPTSAPSGLLAVMRSLESATSWEAVHGATWSARGPISPSPSHRDLPGCPTATHVSSMAKVSRTVPKTRVPIESPAGPTLSTEETPIAAHGSQPIEGQIMRMGQHVDAVLIAGPPQVPACTLALTGHLSTSPLPPRPHPHRSPTGC